MQNVLLRFAPESLVIIELVLMAAAGLSIFRSRLRPSRRVQPSAFRLLKQAFSRLGQRRALSVFFAGVAVVVVRAALIGVLGIPQPRWHDEFSYLLAGDTFAHGRLTNPTHLMWMHFESFHIIQHPTYMSMYPPAQGIVLAIGQLLGHPWIGQLLVTAAFCSTLCWTLQGWLPPRWALLGAILAALRLGILSYWMNTYWCASVAALGGALVLGAWPRLHKCASSRNALLLGLGLVILAGSRPYEGLVFAIPVAIAIMAWLAGRDRIHLEQALLRICLPIFATLLAGAMATGFYYYRVTGSPFVMTYQVNRGQYATAPYFIWQAPRPEPEYHHEVMRNYYRGELREFERNRTLKGYLERSAEKFESWWQFYLGPLLTVPVLALPWIVRQQKMRLPVLLCAAMIAGFSIQTWTFPHYFSPATSALYILIVQGVRHMRQWWGRRSVTGQSMVRAIPMVACAMILVRVVAASTHTHIEPDWPRGNLERVSVLRELNHLPGHQLVIVRYGAHHDVDREWIWNDASIDGAKVVWARDAGESQNQELLRYFSDRQVWTIAGDEAHPKPEPYSATREATRLP